MKALMSTETAAKEVVCADGNDDGKKPKPNFNVMIER